jgi:3-hydroxyisobutyrate dehydrogenase-like beta-hydroxyacid dehydrogenase
MTSIIAIVGAGAMGSGIARRLIENGATVLTSVAGRSAATKRRAHESGMLPVAEERLAEADFILSILPPAEALPFADRMAPLLSAARTKPVFVDCNAVSPATVEAIRAVLAPSLCPFVDAGIIGGPPQPGGAGPAIYASGPEAARFAALHERGLDIRLVAGPVGKASALKLSYAGITKGLTALASAMILAADRSGVGDDLRKELADSQPALLAWVQRQVPGMYAKAYRWVAEMEQIGEFLDAEPAGRGIYDGMARLYEALAADAAGPNIDTKTLSGFVTQAV